MNNFWLRKNDRANLVLAPMAGYTDSAFRLLCREMGADVVMTELISADAIYHNKKLRVKSEKRKAKVPDLFKEDKTLSMLRFEDGERPIVVQLFGKYPEKFAFAAKWVADNIKPDGIDINMGCPARKVVGSDHGAALLKNHDLAIEIVQAVRENIKIPLSVKTRLGWENDNEILEFAPKLVAAGVDAIIIHGRTYKDGFRQSARWQNIYKVKSELLKAKSYKLTAVVGNGDIKSYEEARDKSETGEVKLDGVAIGRAAFGCPSIFSGQRIVKSEKLKEVILKHAELAFKIKGEHGIIEFRKHLLAYTKGMMNAKDIRKLAVSVESIDDVSNIVRKISNI